MGNLESGSFLDFQMGYDPFRHPQRRYFARLFNLGLTTYISTAVSVFSGLGFKPPDSS